MLSGIVIILGLVVFEVISSVDNAIVNAHVLKTMSPKWRKIFLVWGIFTAVFLVRGLLPFVVIWLSVPEIGFSGVWQSMIKSPPEISQLIEERRGIILIGAGVFLLLVYLHWLFLEKKDPYFVPDRLVKPQHGVWFFAFAAIILVGLLYSARSSWHLMLAAALGNAVFFIMYGFREQAEKQEHLLHSPGSNFSDLSKLMYLEVLDASFSFDGVVGAFAFTTSIPLIFLGNGIGALVVRELTIKGIDRVSQYKWLKNGAMTSIGVLGVFIILKSFGVHIPEYLPTITTVGLVGLTFWESHRFLKKNGTN
ncbi:MAG: DUF475 domain-containing protein [Candidatus Nealsonbacteria bacterium]|nr:DUF475 domain-containing protein [Candidatus Nealsonbacteria bacterium]